MATATRIDVRVLARDGKFLGDDSGGAFVTIHDVHSGELLASGRTNGGSGPQDLMSVCLKRSENLPVDGASLFSAQLLLERPRLLRVTATGPLASPQSANTVSATQWIYPGKDITGGKQGGGLFLEIPGLVVQILNPPSHFLPKTAPPKINIRANVTMMCGCPIGPDHPPWFPERYEVTAVVTSDGKQIAKIALPFDNAAPDGAPSQFAKDWKVPKNKTNAAQIYEIVVFAFQRRTGNTGLDRTTAVIPPG